MRFFDTFFFKKFLEPEEEIIYVVHKHWWSVVVAMIKFVTLGFIFPLMVIWLYPNLYVVLGLVLWFFYVVFVFVEDFIDWFHDALLVTSINVIDIDWHGFFHNNANRIGYETIEGVSFEIKGMIPTLFQFGDLKITMPNGEAKLHMVPKVREWQKLILMKRTEIMQKKSSSDDNLAQLKQALETLMAVKPEPNPVSSNLQAHQVMIMKQKKISRK
ncbi:MAG: hypothetical protein A2V81_04930 [Candidatus Abawacabacteria bacterium RBG_16_42_10]|uniref:DUF304 domain-containing protein n=1 Tax=Candidatus Abawacabacteria bacterium RBG_16_42_10 TaxID=1817814 RepID=A0A1F4XIR9_9BACT|nr:MAG: hypothetical protein A2V81_04930 [Candidatus Abawacabacteria bacterium RBG_16_42_10]